MGRLEDLEAKILELTGKLDVANERLVHLRTILEMVKRYRDAPDKTTTEAQATWQDMCVRLNELKQFGEV